MELPLELQEWNIIIDNRAIAGTCWPYKYYLRYMSVASYNFELP